MTYVAEKKINKTIFASFQFSKMFNIVQKDYLHSLALNMFLFWFIFLHTFYIHLIFNGHIRRTNVFFCEPGPPNFSFFLPNTVVIVKKLHQLLENFSLTFLNIKINENIKIYIAISHIKTQM